jgi:sugar phosphate isomerase/epimerase
LVSPASRDSGKSRPGISRDRIAVQQTVTRRWTFEDDVAAYRDAGFRSIGVWRHKAAECGEERAIDLLLDSRLKCSSVAYSGGFTLGSSVEAIEDGLDAVDFAAAVNARCVVVTTGARHKYTRNHALRRLICDALAMLCDLASERRVTVALLPLANGVGGGASSMLHSAGESLDLVRRLRCDNLRLALDLNSLASDAGFLPRIDEIAAQTSVVFADIRFANSPAWGILEMLELHGYRGGYELCSHGPGSLVDHRETLDQCVQIAHRLAEPAKAETSPAK